MVIKITSLKTRNYLFIISTVITITVLVSLTPIMLNFEEYAGFGFYNTNRDYRTNYSDGYGEVNVDLLAELAGRDTYSWYISCHLSSSGNVEIVGITHFNYTINAGGGIVSARSYDWDPPRVQYSRGARVFLRYREYLIWSGSAEVKFISNSIVQNETIDFSVTIVVAYSSQDYVNLDLVTYIATFSWVIAFIVVPLILAFIIQPHYGIHLDEETLKKQKKYFDYFKKSQEEES